MTREVVLDPRASAVGFELRRGGVPIDPKTLTRRGYGTELIQKGLAYALEADVDYDPGSSGVRCRIGMPIT